MPSNHKRPNQGRGAPTPTASDAAPAEPTAAEKSEKALEQPKAAATQEAPPPAQSTPAPPPSQPSQSSQQQQQQQQQQRQKGLNITDLKDMGIQKLTQIAKDLNVGGATGMRKQDLIFQILKAQTE